MQKFMATWENNGEKLSGVRSAENRQAVEAFMVEHYYECTNIFVQTLASWYDSQIREHIQKLKFSDRICNDPEYMGQVKERLRACADAAYMFGEDAQESLERTLSRMVDCGWEITGLDGHMFSFGFKSNAFHGGIIFHCNSKTWASHT